MTSLDYDTLLSLAEPIIREAGALVLEHHRQPRHVRYKSRIDPVTATDLAVEHFLQTRLQQLLPDSTFMAEESATELTPAGCTWIIDPVDGTVNFVHGLPFVAISVGLWHEGAVQLGVVHAPLLDECYTARRGAGAFCNGVPLSVSATDMLTEALLATGFPYSIDLELNQVLARMRAVLPHVQGLRRCGAAALDLAWVAAGKFDAFYEDNLKPWDIAAGLLLLEEAGGISSDFSGNPCQLEKGEVLASNGHIHTVLQTLLAPS